MVTENCDRCQISGEKAGLYDVIYEGRMGKLCERCAIIENIPVLKKPNVIQLKESEKNYEVYERMKRMSGYKEPIRETSFMREQRLRELEKNPQLELPIKKQLNLNDHFHWEIMRNRRRKGLSHKQLAEAIGESEIAIDMLEKGKLPENSEGIIKKLEQFFQVSLRKISEADAMVIRKQKMTRTKPVLLDEDGNELEHIPEPVVETGEYSDIYLESREVKDEKKEIPWYKKILGRKKQETVEENPEDSDEEMIEESPRAVVRQSNVPGSRYLSYRRKEAIRKGEVIEDDEPRIELKENEDLDLEKVDLNRVRISDLKDVHKKRVEATKSERVLEQKKIEEKQRLIEARKEELRAMKEKESKNIDSALGGSELLGKKDAESGDDFEELSEEYDEE